MKLPHQSLLIPILEAAVRRIHRGWCLSCMRPNQGRRRSLFGHSSPLISSDEPPNMSIDSNHRQHTDTGCDRFSASGVCQRRMARSGSGLSYVLTYNSADSESSEPVLQHAMYYRLYHHSWFAGCKTYARHVPLRVAPAGLRDKDRRPLPEGCFPAI